MRVLRVHFRAGMASEFLPDFHGHTRICQSRVECVPQLNGNSSSIANVQRRLLRAAVGH